MKKWNLIVDVAECTNCNNCFVSCKDEYVGNDIKGYSAPQPLHGHKWINILKKERGSYPTTDIAYVPTMCNHCDNAPCIAKADGAITKRSDGIVIIDPEKARNRKDLVKSCPYGAIWWNEEEKLPQTWIFDAHLLDRGWEQPRCVQSCPTGALKSVKISDKEMAAIVEDENLETINVALMATKPRVHYKNLHLYNKVFVAGEVLASINGVADCVFNATVDLYSQGEKLATTETDEFGEYKIDGLNAGLGACELRISHEKHPVKTIPVTINDKSVVTDRLLLVETL